MRDLTSPPAPAPASAVPETGPGQARPRRNGRADAGLRGAGESEGVVEAFSLGAIVFRARLLPQRLGDRADRRRALGGQVAANDRRAAERGADLDVAVVEAVVGTVGVGLPHAPALDRAPGD